MSLVMPILPGESRVRIYTASAGQTAFAASFPFQANADILVQYTPAGETLFTDLVEGDDYTLTGAGTASGGILTLVTPAAAGDTVTIIGQAVLSRVSSVVQAGVFRSITLDEEFDRNRIIQQEFARDIDRQLLVPPGQTGGLIFMPDEANRFLVTDGNGNLVDGGSAEDIANAQANAEIAAEAAEQSEAILDAVNGVASSILAAKFSTVAAAEAYSPAIAPNYIETAGYSAAGDGGGALYVATASDPGHAGKLSITLADGVTTQLYKLADGQVYSDRMFGVAADAVLDANSELVSGTDDTAALMAFAQFMRVRGGGRFVFDGGIRRVWPSVIANGTILMDLNGVNGARIEYLNGAAIHAEHPNPTTEVGSTIYGIVWHLTGADNLEIVNPRLTQEGHKVPTFDAGAVHFDWGWANNVASAPFTSVKITGVYQLGGIAGIIVRDKAGSTIDFDISSGLEFEGYFEEVYYPCNLQGNGDMSKVKMRTEKCGRTLFAYNVFGLTADLIIFNPSLTSGTVNLTCYDTTTMRNQLRDCTIRAHVRGGWTGDPSAGLPNNVILFPLNLIHTDGVGGAKITNIKYDIDVLMTSNTAGGKVIAVNKYDNSGAVAADATARGHLVNGVVWRGSAEGNFTGAVEPFSLFCDNPLGAENWNGDLIANCGFERFIAIGSEMDINLDGRGVNASVGTFFFRDSFFGGSAHSFTNALGKLQSLNSSIALRGSYVPAWTADSTNPVVNDGSISGEYDIDGDWVSARVSLTIGSTTTLGSGNWRFSLPIAPVASSARRFGQARVFDTGANVLTGVSEILSGESVLRGQVDQSGNNFNSGTPIAWVAGDSAQLEIRYRWR